MDDMSIDTVILEICKILYNWTSDIRISLISEELEGRSGTKYSCSIVMMTGMCPSEACGMNDIENCRVKMVLMGAIEGTLADAKKLLLNRLLERCKKAREVPVEKVMNS